MGILSWLIGGGCENIKAEELKAMRNRKEDVFVLDVRTPGEYQRRKIEGAKLIPLNELEMRLKEVPRDKDVVVYCNSGFQSLFACRKLKEFGYDRIKNLSGGISRW